MNIVLCKDTAVATLEKFKEHWEFEDPKEIASEGKETSISEFKDVLIASIMQGRTEIAEDNSTITYTFREPVGKEEVRSATFTVGHHKQHMNRELQGAKNEADAMNKFIQLQTGLTAYQFSELRGKDVGALTAIAAHLFFI